MRPFELLNSPVTNVPRGNSSFRIMIEASWMPAKSSFLGASYPRRKISDSPFQFWNTRLVRGTV